MLDRAEVVVIETNYVSLMKKKTFDKFFNGPAF